MTSSGVLDTSKLVLLASSASWGGTGTEDNSTPGDIDIMGGNDAGTIDLSYGFHAGTDASAITNPGGPFAFDHFSVANITGSNEFATYSGFDSGLRQPGITIERADIVAGLWTPDQTWTYSPGDTFASLGLIAGDYLVTDAVTGESIDIRIGSVASVPEPSTLAILSAGLIGLGGFVRRRRQERNISPA